MRHIFTHQTPFYVPINKSLRLEQILRTRAIDIYLFEISNEVKKIRQLTGRFTQHIARHFLIDQMANGKTDQISMNFIFIFVCITEHFFFVLKRKHNNKFLQETTNEFINEWNATAAATSHTSSAAGKCDDAIIQLFIIITLLWQSPDCRHISDASYLRIVIVDGSAARRWCGRRFKQQQQ